MLIDAFFDDFAQVFCLFKCKDGVLFCRIYLIIALMNFQQEAREQGEAGNIEEDSASLRPTSIIGLDSDDERS